MIGRKFIHFLSTALENRPRIRLKPVIKKAKTIYSDIDDALNILNMSTIACKHMVHLEQVQMYETSLHATQNNFCVASKFILLSRIASMFVRLSNKKGDAVAYYILILFTFILATQYLGNYIHIL